MPLTKEEQIELAWAEHHATYNRPAGNLTIAMRWRLAEQQNWRCCWCGIRMEGAGFALDAPTFEHIVPRSKGGTDELDNIAVACRRCNEERGSGE